MPWKNPFIQEDNYNKAIYWSLLVTLLSLAFSIRFINSISVFLLVAITLMHPNQGAFFKRALHNPYFIACIALFLTKAAGLFYTNHFDESWKQASGKIIWVAIPFFFCANKHISYKIMWRLVFYFTLALSIVSIYCLIYAFFSYAQQQDSSVFFYHQLVQPAKHHAIFFSFFLFFCIVYWIEEGLTETEKKIHRNILIGLIIYFFILIVLLASKLVIAVLFLYLIYFGLRLFWKAKAKLAVFVFIFCVAAAMAFLTYTNNPVKERFLDTTRGNMALFKQERYSPDVYFNGVQLRLLIWRFTYEILNENEAWFLGVSSGDAQFELNKKYIEANVYQGNGRSDNKGYLLFNCHNVFLQTALESGLLGLFVLIALISIFLYQVIKRKRASTLIFFMAILAFCFTESVLTSQYTILLFMFFPLLSLSKITFKEG